MSTKGGSLFFFSIILPLSSTAPYKKVKKCILSAISQTEKDFEVIIVADKTWRKKLESFKDIHLLEGNFTKTQARNLGSEKSKGKYLIHLDHDIYLQPNSLSKLKKLLIKTEAEAVNVLPTITGSCYLNKIYKLEYEITKVADLYKGFPVIKKETFFKLGGYNEEVDALDDWNLKAKLIRNKIAITTVEKIADYDPSMTIPQLIIRKVERGRCLPVFKEIYPKECKKIASRNMLLGAYFSNSGILAKNLISTLGLVILKPFEWIILLLSSFFPTGFNKYESVFVAKNYDRLRTHSNYQNYKFYAETTALGELLEKEKTVIEVAAGTGRITRYLVKKGLDVTPTEISEAMTEGYKKKIDLPKIIKLKGEDLDKLKSKTDLVIGIRLIWHIKDEKIRTKILEKSALVSKFSIIYDLTDIDFATDLYKKWDILLYRKIPLDVIRPIWLNLVLQKHAVKLFPYIYKLDKKMGTFIPPGRWMVKFIKNI